MEKCQGIILLTKKPCEKQAVKNGFCGKHQEQLFLKKASEEGKTVCRMFARGCRNYLSDIDISKEFSTCEACRAKLCGKEKQCSHPGCDFKIEEKETYCGKHYRDSFKNTGVKYCNIPRGCDSILKEGEKVCEKCIKKFNDKVYDELKSFRGKILNCLKCCGEKDTAGDYFCGKCKSIINYIKEADSKRLIRHIWHDYCKGVASRDLTMPISYEKFVDLTIRPCFYCNRFSENRYNGIDRYDNTIGYTEENVRPCCTNCNMMKNNYNPDAFTNKIDAIVSYQLSGKSNMEEIVKIWPELMSKAKNVYKVYKHESIHSRKIEFLLTQTQYESFKGEPCYLCGIQSSPDHINGIDRVNNSDGYTIENCKSCCGHCNLMKATLPLEEFLSQCHLINKYNKPDKTHQRVFTAKEVYDVIESGKINNYIDIAKKEGKSTQYIVGIKDIDISSITKEEVLAEIRRQMEHERSRAYKNSKSEALHYSAATIYTMLVSGEIDKFTSWYKTTFGVSNSFHTKLEELVKSLSAVEKKDGVDLCRKFLNGERSRRQSMLTTSLKKKATPDKKEKSWVAPKLTAPTPTIEIHNIIVPTPLPADVVPSYVGPKQWKSELIYKYIMEGKGNQYKKYCEENNTIEDIDAWNTVWNTFEGTITVIGGFEFAKPIIQEFIESLRKTRTLKLLEKTKKNILDRTDREVWPKETILQAFNADKMNDVKTHYEKKDTGTNWEKRWAKLLEDLGSTKNNTEQLEIIRKFQNNHRKSCYTNKGSKPN
jgi:hypothetical protein